MNVFPGDDEGTCASIGSEPWFPNQGETDTAAKRICRRCPVIEPCRDYALAWLVKGVWGGTNETDRETIRRQTGTKASHIFWDVA